MKIFIFSRIDKCSYNYHSEGGLVIIAHDVDSAKELISTNDSIIITDEEWNDVEIFELAEKVSERCWVFPDAGCC